MNLLILFALLLLFSDALILINVDPFKKELWIKGQWNFRTITKVFENSYYIFIWYYKDENSGYNFVLIKAIRLY